MLVEEEVEEIMSGTGTENYIWGSAKFIVAVFHDHNVKLLVGLSFA